MGREGTPLSATAQVIHMMGKVLCMLLMLLVSGTHGYYRSKQQHWRYQNPRTGSAYLTWRGDEADLTMPGKEFFVPAVDNYDLTPEDAQQGVTTIPPKLRKKIQRTCSQNVFAPKKQGKDSVRMMRERCFADGDLLLPTFNQGSFKHVVPFPGKLGDTVHHVLSSEQIFAGTVNQTVTACHTIPFAKTTMCHDLTKHDSPRLFNVVTEKSTQGGAIEQVTLNVLCHKRDAETAAWIPEWSRGCHVLAPGDVIFGGEPVSTANALKQFQQQKVDGWCACYCPGQHHCSPEKICRTCFRL